MSIVFGDIITRKGLGPSRAVAFPSKDDESDDIADEVMDGAMKQAADELSDQYGPSDSPWKSRLGNS